MKELELWRRIGAFPENEAHLRDLVTQVQTNHGVVPFVGAGLSIPLFPGWTKFLQGLGESAGSATLAAVNQQLGSGHYEEAAELVQTKLGSRRFQEHLEDTFGDHRLPEQPISGAVTSIPRISSGVVITTNFDRLLERTFDEAGTPTRHFWGRDALEKGGRHLQREESVLLKLHGDYETSSGRVLTLKDYQQCYGNTAGCTVDANLPIPSMLMAILATRSLLFVGCSLAADRTVPLLQHIANRFTGNVQFAIVSHPASEDEFQERARLLSEMGIRPIWYPTNRHELVQDILEHLAAARAERPESKLAGPTAPATTATAKGNAPRPTTPLVGRQAELSTLDRMLDACRMITIAGGPGTGKTRVAIELARRVESRFPQGVWFVELDSLRETRFVPQRIANVLGIREQLALALAMPDGGSFRQELAGSASSQARYRRRSNHRCHEKVAHRRQEARRLRAIPSTASGDSSSAERFERGVRNDDAFYGELIAERIGLDRIRSECVHFASWLAKLESLGRPTLV